MPGGSTTPCCGIGTPLTAPASGQARGSGDQERAVNQPHKLSRCQPSKACSGEHSRPAPQRARLRTGQERRRHAGRPAQRRHQLRLLCLRGFQVLSQAVHALGQLLLSGWVHRWEGG